VIGLLVNHRKQAEIGRSWRRINVPFVMMTNRAAPRVPRDLQILSICRQILNELVPKKIPKVVLEPAVRFGAVSTVVLRKLETAE
jgi:hypothetical protein